ncbi:unnamed protein product [Peniophora sp. CBMAI 1063]|nr:unnamed protein product [Peniophora sp. CBMAI 1063]
MAPPVAHTFVKREVSPSPMHSPTFATRVNHEPAIDAQAADAAARADPPQRAQVSSTSDAPRRTSAVRPIPLVLDRESQEPPPLDPDHAALHRLVGLHPHESMVEAQVVAEDGVSLRHPTDNRYIPYDQVPRDVLERFFSPNPVPKMQEDTPDECRLYPTVGEVKPDDTNYLVNPVVLTGADRCTHCRENYEDYDCIRSTCNRSRRAPVPPCDYCLILNIPCDVKEGKLRHKRHPAKPYDRPARQTGGSVQRRAPSLPPVAGPSNHPDALIITPPPPDNKSAPAPGLQQGTNVGQVRGIGHADSHAESLLARIDALERRIAQLESRAP